MSSSALITPPQAGSVSLGKKSSVSVLIKNPPENDSTSGNYTNENTNYTKNFVTNTTNTTNTNQVLKEKKDKCLIF